MFLEGMGKNVSKIIYRVSQKNGTRINYVFAEIIIHTNVIIIGDLDISVPLGFQIVCTVYVKAKQVKSTVIHGFRF